MLGPAGCVVEVDDLLASGSGGEGGEAGDDGDDDDDGTSGGEVDDPDGVDGTADESGGSDEGHGEGSDGSDDGGSSTPCGDVFTDPFGDGSLRLSGAEVFRLGPGPYELTSICVEDEAQLQVCGSTHVILTGDVISVIGGRGLAPAGPFDVDIELTSGPEVGEVWIYFNDMLGYIALTFTGGVPLSAFFTTAASMGVSLDGGGVTDATFFAGATTEPFPPCPLD